MQPKLLQKKNDKPKSKSEKGIHMLDKKSQIKLAKILADYFNDGDWQELFAVTNCEDVPEKIHNFYRHVHWNNPELKGAAMTAVQDTLGRSAVNITLIWELDRVQHLIRRDAPDLFDEIDTIVSNKGQKKYPLHL